MASFKPREVVSILKKSGSHLMMYNKIKNKIIPVPIHNKDLGKGLIKTIIKEANSTEEKFLALK